jgi:hypothetical protein
VGLKECGEIGHITDRWPARKAPVNVMMRTGCELYFGHYPHSVFFLNHKLSGTNFVSFYTWQNKIWNPSTLSLLVSNRLTSCASGSRNRTLCFIMSLEEENVTSFRNTVDWITVSLDERNVANFRNAIMWIVMSFEGKVTNFWNTVFWIIMSLEEGNFANFGTLLFELCHSKKETSSILKHCCLNYYVNRIGKCQQSSELCGLETMDFK